MKFTILAILLVFNILVPVLSSRAQTLDQQITFNTIPQKTFGDAPFDLVATATSGLSVTFSSSNSSIATIARSAVTINSKF
ncbi:MAG: hypothetical protein OEV74_17540 [Cyclobacteriaceae bacterium]|nr:hypothetical protein [Cyclobacteriaceae bacterium]MDH4298085.1 hypothetical protein [Cyclobacteriaceae bacterium]